MPSSELATAPCPSCGAPLRLFGETRISWDEEKKEFQVSMKGVCPPCGYKGDLAIKTLPLFIAKSSSCSCGGSLVLADHSFNLSNGDLEFRATYRCSTCTKHEKSLLQRLASGLHQVWKDTTSVEVGPTGIKYGKRAS